jgi:hypothetical protein
MERPTRSPFLKHQRSDVSLERMSGRGHGWSGCLEGFPLVAAPCADTASARSLAGGYSVAWVRLTAQHCSSIARGWLAVVHGIDKL